MNEKNNNLNTQFNNNNQQIPNQKPEDSAINKTIRWGVGQDNKKPTNRNDEQLVKQNFLKSEKQESSNVNNLNNQNRQQNQNLQAPQNVEIYTLENSPLFNELKNSSNNQSNNNIVNGLSQNVNQNSLLKQSQQQSNVNSVMQNNNLSHGNANNQNLLDNQDWMNNQPLSAASLGVNTNPQPEDQNVQPKNKFFDPNLNKKLDEIQSRQEQEQQAILQQKIANKSLNEKKKTIDEMALLKKYVGEKFTKITMSPFSFSALIFGVIYLFYRKMYLFGLIFLLIQTGILLFVPIKIALIVNAVLLLILALSVNYIYIGIAKHRVKKIVKNKKNIDKTQTELNKICKKKGGVSLAKAVLIFLLISFAVGAGIIYKIGLDKVQDYINKVVDYFKPKPEMEQNVYNGTLYYNTIYNGEVFEVIVPNEFKNIDGLYKYKINDKSTCKFQMQELKNFTKAEEFINQYKNYHKIENEIEIIEKNGITLYSISNIEDREKTYIKATDFNDTVILFNYYEKSLDNNTVCEKYFNEITDSIIRKEE